MNNPSEPNRQNTSKEPSKTTILSLSELLRQRDYLIEVIGEGPEEADKHTRAYLADAVRDNPAEGAALLKEYENSNQSGRAESVKEPTKDSKTSYPDFDTVFPELVSNLNKNVIAGVETN